MVRLLKLTILLFAGIAAWAESYDLERRFSPGQSWTFEQTHHVEMSSPAMAGGSQSFAVNLQLTEKVLKVNPDGTVELAVTIDDVQSEQPSAQMMGMDYGLLKGKTLRVMLDNRAVATAVLPPEDLSEEAETIFSMMKQYYLYMFGEGDYPDKPVAMGESWDTKRTYSMEIPLGVLDQIDTFKSTLEGKQDYQGVACLKVGFKGNFTGTFREGVDGTIEGDYEGSRLIDQASGRSLKLDMSIVQRWSRVTHQGEALIDYRISYSREMLPDEDAIR